MWERWLSLTTTCTFVSDSSPLVSQWGGRERGEGRALHCLHRGVALVAALAVVATGVEGSEGGSEGPPG